MWPLASAAEGVKTDGRLARGRPSLGQRGAASAPAASIAPERRLEHCIGPYPSPKFVAGARRRRVVNGPAAHRSGHVRPIETKAVTRMTHQSPAREPLLELYDAVAQRQLRDAGAEVAAAIAHAVGTPLNVISGRAELIRHDPSNALAQVARIEEQVKKLATGLRQLVDYLAVPDPRAPQQSTSAAAHLG